MKKYDVITIGGILRDFTFYIKEGKILKDQFTFPLDSKIQVKEAYFTNGGGANNVAVGLARFGLKVGIIGRIGDDFSGQAILKNLKKHQIETKFIHIDKKNHTGVSLIIQKEGKKIIFTYRGASHYLKISNLKPLKLTKWIFISALTGDWKRNLNKIFKEALKYKVKIAWNPGTAQLSFGKDKLLKYLKKTTVLILNQYEARKLIFDFEISFRKENFKSEIKNLLIRLHSLGPEIVAITCGPKGAFVFDGKKIYYEKALKIKIKDTTGAGDAFSSGFLAGLILFNEIKKALKLAILNSGAVIKLVGAQEGLLNKKILKKL
jgi:sugar/nucleoside kinase (ribokinase family)